MGRARRGHHGRVVFAGMLAAHAVLLLFATLGLRPRTEALQTELAVAPVYLADLRRKPRPKPEQRPGAAAAAAAPRPVLSRPDLAPGPAVVQSPEPATGSAAESDSQRLARVLRGGRVGCANPSILNEAEQLRCQDQLEAGSKLAKHIPTPLPPERRAYYDAIVKEKAATPNSAIVQSAGNQGMVFAKGGPGMLAGDGTRGMPGRPPGFGCKIAFGGPKGTNGYKRPPNSLQLGPLPCAITPPVGPLSVEAAIQNPDKVVRDKKKAAER